MSQMSARDLFALADTISAHIDEARARMELVREYAKAEALREAITLAKLSTARGEAPLSGGFAELSDETAVVR